MDPALGPHPLTLLVLVVGSFAAVIAVILLLFRSGRSVDFPELNTKFRPLRRTPDRDHAPNR